MTIIMKALLLAFLLVSCTPAIKSTPPETVVPTATLPAEPESPLESGTQTSVADTPTAVPTATEATSALTPNGPWLAYLQYGISIVNQDGTGRTILDDLECGGAGIQENPLNRLVIFPRAVYLVQPEATWTLIYREWPCNTDFTGDEKGGLLATIHHSTTNAIPELRIYELPSGKIRDQFPLLKCSDRSDSCNFPDSAGPNFKWSPNGKYLAFSAIRNGPSSDLYVYDMEDGKTRQLTSGPDHVGSIWWSPDGSQIIMGETLFENTYPGFGPSSLWAVSVSDNEIRLLYSLEDPYPQGLLGWLDNKRFIVYDGPTSLANALDLPAFNLRVVDITSGEVTTLFNGSFMAAILDVSHETVVFLTNDEEPREGFEGPGIYLVSASHPRLHPLKDVRSLTWNDDLALFVTDDPCENDPAGRKAFNYGEEWQCVHPGITPESLASPDGTWQVVLQDGFWLKTKDQTAIQVSEETPTQIIWRIDSAGFFFVANQILYYSSLPEIDIKVVDEYPGGDSIVYQWVGGN